MGPILTGPINNEWPKSAYLLWPFFFDKLEERDQYE